MTFRKALLGFALCTVAPATGWADDGTLVLKQHEVAGDVPALDPAAAAKLQKQGVEILSIATGGKNK